MLSRFAKHLCVIPCLLVLVFGCGEEKGAGPTPTAASWSIQSSGVPFGSVWSASSSDIFAVGTRGTIRHFDGSNWKAMKSAVASDLHGVWGSSGSDVFAVGQYKTVLHYDGASWKPMGLETNAFLYRLLAVWGSSSADVFVVGESGAIFHYNGVRWTQMESGQLANLFGIWGSTGTNVFVVGTGGIVLHYDGNSWVEMTG